MPPPPTPRERRRTALALLLLQTSRINRPNPRNHVLCDRTNQILARCSQELLLRYNLKRPPRYAATAKKCFPLEFPHEISGNAVIEDSVTVVDSLFVGEPKVDALAKR